MKVFFVFFLVLVFGVVSSHGKTHEYNAPTPFKTSMTKPYDEFFLVQQWPASFCRGPSRSCLLIPSYFTVHGLWAQLKSGEPVNCAGKTFDISKLNRDTVSNLRKYWPNLIGKDQNFWAHEYNTHASCIWPFQAGPQNYFSSTLELAQQYNVTTKLLAAGIQPDIKRYRITSIRNAIFYDIKVYPTLECNYADGTIQLFQIYLCFDKTASKLMNCSGQPYKNCPRQNWDDLISFPSQSRPVLSSTGKWTMN